MCHSVLSDLTYVDKMMDVDAVDTKMSIEGWFVKLAASIASEEEGAQLSQEPSSPPKKRAKNSPGKGGEGSCTTDTPFALFFGKGAKANVDRSNELHKLGLFTKVPVTGQPPPSNLEKAKDELSRLRQVPGADLGNFPVTELLGFWQGAGSTRFPTPARAARVVLGAPASSGRTERDFSTAGQLMASTRSRADSGWVEMLLFLHGNSDLIPMNVLELYEEEEEDEDEDEDEDEEEAEQ